MKRHRLEVPAPVHPAEATHTPLSLTSSRTLLLLLILPPAAPAFMASGSCRARAATWEDRIPVLLLLRRGMRISRRGACETPVQRVAANEPPCRKHQP
eukprot:755677-Hanusia_phi.AAC.5